MESLSLLIQSIIVNNGTRKIIHCCFKDISVFLSLSSDTQNFSSYSYAKKQTTEKVLFIMHVRMHLLTCIINLISASRPISVFNKQQKKSFSVDRLAHFFANMLIIFIFISQIKKNINYNFFLTISILSFTLLICG